MDNRMEADAGPVLSPASSDIAAMVAALRRHVRRLEDIHGHALSVSLLPWESPAGANFRSYLSERCAEVARTADLLESASRLLADYGRLIQDAEMQRQAGL
jgi:hypothetical protein